MDYHDVRRALVAYPSFWLTRVVLVRATCFIYAVAFLVAFNQNTALLGTHGLLPFDLYMSRLEAHHGCVSRWLAAGFFSPHMLCVVGRMSHV